jgi:hypothetical protein
MYFSFNFKHTMEHYHIFMRNITLTCVLMYHEKLELAMLNSVDQQ